MPKLESILSINDNIYLEVLDGPLEGKSFVTRVEDIAKDNMVLAAPFDKEKKTYVSLQNGTKVRVSFPKKDAIYQFNAKILDSRTGRLPVVIISKPKELLRFQRREFVRLDDIIRVSYKIAVSEDMKVKYKLVDRKELDNIELEGKEEKFLNGFTKNISGNGMLLVIKKDIAKIGNLLEISFTLPDRKKVFNVIGEIVRIADEVKVDLPDEIGVGIRFVKIDEKDRTEIIKYIFDKQREMIKKGLVNQRRKGGIVI